MKTEQRREAMVCGCEAVRGDRVKWYGQYYRCNACGLIQTVYNVPADHYGRGYFAWIETLRPRNYVFDQAERVAQMMQKLRPISGGKMMGVDYGCGNGEFTRALHWAFGGCVWWVGVDKYSQRADTIEMPHDADYVHCVHVLEHVSDPVGVLREMYYNSKPGAVAFFQVPHEKLTLWVYRILGIKPDTRDNGHVTIYDRKSFSRCIKRAGWRVAWCEYDSCADDIAKQIGAPLRARLWQRIATWLGRSCYISALCYK